MTRITSPIFTFSAGIIFSFPSSIILAFCGVKCTSFSIPALAFSTVRSSSKVPSCIINATSPAAKISPIQTEAINARETRTSAFISNAVMSPIMASMTIGTPQSIMAIHAASKGRGIKLKILIIRETAETMRKIISFFIPPICIIFSAFFARRLIYLAPFYTYGGICILYRQKYELSREIKKRQS